MKQQPSILHEHTGADCTLITFGGIRNGLGMPQFEFVRSLGSLKANKIFVRDFAQAWYQKGVPGHPSVLALADYLAKHTQGQQTLIIGNSMGGFAALLFGALINATYTIAFAPQTFIGAKLRAIHKDNRWNNELSRLHEESGTEGEYYNLLPIMEQYQPSAEIVYGGNARMDALHAERLAHVPSIRLQCQEQGLHNVIVLLRDSGRLKEMVEKWIT